MKTEKIKSCPFCGCKKVEVCRTNPYACWIRCANCGADAKSNPDRKKAIRLWNRRAKEEFAEIVDDMDKEAANELK